MGTERDTLLELLRSLVLTDLDAIEAYEAAVPRLLNEGAKATLVAFQSDHERHVRALTELLEGLGAKAPGGADLMGLVAKGRVVVGNVAGEPGILAAMRSNEDLCNHRYEQALLQPDLTPELRRLLELHLADERRHRGWVEDQLRSRRPSTIPPAFGAA